MPSPRSGKRVQARADAMSAAPRQVPGPNDLHIWWIALQRPLPSCSTVLPADEEARASRFKRPADRAAWISARVALRQILARYTGDDPAEIRLARGAFGKPALPGDSPVRFNLSQARERAVLAIAWDRDVGIDLEPNDPGRDVSPLLSGVCCQREAAHLRVLPPAARLEEFLAIWVAKEAYLKGIGTGLSRDPRAIEIMPCRGCRSAVRDSLAVTRDHPWSVRRLDAGPGWSGAVAFPGLDPAITVFHWPLVEDPPRAAAGPAPATLA
jgi:4'-phosphopantetheinyl transferase